jgi:hypothetical protein
MREVDAIENDVLDFIASGKWTFIDTPASILYLAGGSR